MLKKGKSDTIFFNVLKQTQLYMNRLSLRIVQNKKVNMKVNNNVNLSLLSGINLPKKVDQTFCK